MAANHHQTLVAEQPLAALAYIEALALAMLQRGQGKVQVTDTAARAVAPARHGAILGEDFVQGVNQRTNLAARFWANRVMRCGVSSPVESLNPPCARDISSVIALATFICPDLALSAPLSGRIGIHAVTSIGAAVPILAILAILATLAVLLVLAVLAGSRAVGRVSGDVGMAATHCRSEGRPSAWVGVLLAIRPLWLLWLLWLLRARRCLIARLRALAGLPLRGLRRRWRLP